MGDSRGGTAREEGVPSAVKHPVSHSVCLFLYCVGVLFCPPPSASRRGRWGGGHGADPHGLGLGPVLVAGQRLVEAEVQREEPRDPRDVPEALRTVKMTLSAGRPGVGGGRQWGPPGVCPAVGKRSVFNPPRTHQKQSVGSTANRTGRRCIHEGRGGRTATGVVPERHHRAPASRPRARRPPLPLGFSGCRWIVRPELSYFDFDS